MRGFKQKTLLEIGLLVLVASGCGDGRPSRVPVSGQVLIDGKPLTFGDIMFVPQGGRASQSSIDKKGRFSLTCFETNDGALLGSHQVSVTAAEPVSSRAMRWRAPKKFADVRTSGLTQQITGPTENLVINISWEGGHEFDEITDEGGDDVRPKNRRPK
jgi:hypothetical protein